MNYKDAKAIDESFSKGAPLERKLVSENWMYARGYLNCHAKAEKLVEALKDISDHSESPFSGEKWMSYINEVAEKTLTEWQKENNEEE